MDKKKAIKWLAAYMSPPDAEKEDAALLALELGLEIEEADTIIAEFEEKLIELFLEWYNETVDVAAEDVKDA